MPHHKDRAIFKIHIQIHGRYQRPNILEPAGKQVLEVKAVRL